MKTKEFEKVYWGYYLHLENRFLVTGDYVSFDEANFKTFSNEYVAILQTVCSEIDVILKDMCGYAGANNKTMKDYAEDIKIRVPSIESERVQVNYFNSEIKPFENLSGTMVWWKNYNAVKHDRINYFKAANLQSVVSSLAALFLLNRLYLKSIEANAYYFIIQSRLFKNPDWDDKGLQMGFKVEDGFLVTIMNDDDN
ncbi:MAG: hypothetical protein EOM68_14870 [Spirochaetia bacterium]|nr:hypothetical protein [Spirochaetia bacterium]